MSLSARRAWIEINAVRFLYNNSQVALRKESVDRNRDLTVEQIASLIVALRKESVDRNAVVRVQDCDLDRSLSARRAWIEIIFTLLHLSRFLGRSPQGERG